jgi:hypothetical protein
MRKRISARADGLIALFEINLFGRIVSFSEEQFSIPRLPVCKKLPQEKIRLSESILHAGTRTSR